LVLAVAAAITTLTIAIAIRHRHCPLSRAISLRCLPPLLLCRP
jgi:hypothetical protein